MASSCVHHGLAWRTLARRASTGTASSRSSAVDPLELMRRAERERGTGRDAELPDFTTAALVPCCHSATRQEIGRAETGIAASATATNQVHSRSAVEAAGRRLAHAPAPAAAPHRIEWGWYIRVRTIHRAAVTTRGPRHHRAGRGRGPRRHRPRHHRPRRRRLQREPRVRIPRRPLCRAGAARAGRHGRRPSPAAKTARCRRWRSPASSSRALVELPAAGGRDPARARLLAEQAAAYYRGDGKSDPDAARLEAWLLTHP